MAVYNDGRMTVAGTTIPSEVIDAVMARMQTKTFTTNDLAQTALRVCDEINGPKTTAFTVAERMVRINKLTGNIIQVGVTPKRRHIYSWAA